MARDHARISLTIWQDDDFRDLTGNAQRLYMYMLTANSMTYCGSIDWRPKRVAKTCCDWSLGNVHKAASELGHRGYAVFDNDTEEALIRSWIRNDGLLKQPNLGVSMAKAYGELASPELRGVVIHELNRLHDEQPDLPSWDRTQVTGMLKLRSIDWRDLVQSADEINPDVDPRSEVGLGPGFRSDLALIPNEVETPPTPSPSPTPSPLTPSPRKNAAAGAADYPLEFSEFWEAYPKKRGKDGALKKWKVAKARVGAEVILAGARRYAADPNRDPQFTKDPATWLYNGCWDDEPERPRTSGKVTQDDNVAAWGSLKSDGWPMAVES